MGCFCISAFAKPEKYPMLLLSIILSLLSMDVKGNIHKD
jgi:hypothetical protein